MTQPRSLRWLGVAAGFVLMGVGSSLTREGWWALLGMPLFLVGAALAQPLWAAFHTGDPRSLRRKRIGGTVGLFVFFAGSSAILSWAVLSPSGGCIDCDGPWALPIMAAINLFAWAFGVLLVWNAWKHPLE